MAEYPLPNPGKQLEIQVAKETWNRWPIRTPVIGSESNLSEILKERTQGLLQQDDLIIIAESVVAISQGRAIQIDKINPTRMATFLSRFVRKVPWGIGLGRPETMQLAIEECGLLRIMCAAVAGGLGKALGIRGLFYRLAGPQARLIDGPCQNTLPPYNEYATMGPRAPQKVAHDLAVDLGVTVAIVDANDIGTHCIGAFPKQYQGHSTRQLVEALTRDNPAGQSSEQTPLILGRRIS
jgi:F420-0:gamma-glutamyl ligase-like protein